LPVVKYKSCPIQLSYKVAEKDKHKMAVEVASRKISGFPSPPPSATSQRSFSDAVPPSKYLKEDEDGWTTFLDPILYVYAGKGPYVSR
jgi:sphingosine kinase